MVLPTVKCLSYHLMLINEANLIFAIYCWSHVRKELDLGSSRGCHCELYGVPCPHSLPQFLECALVKGNPIVWEKHMLSYAIQQTPGKHPALFQGFHLWPRFQKASRPSRQASSALLIKRIKVAYFPWQRCL